jgi:hypothetical protein
MWVAILLTPGRLGGWRDNFLERNKPTPRAVGPWQAKPFRRAECNKVANPDIDSDADAEKDHKISTSGAPLCGASQSHAF